MFKQDDVAYFVFQGDFDTGRYNDFYCKPSGCTYFPFMPIKIVQEKYNTYRSMRTCIVAIGEQTRWIMPIDLIEEEFSFDKFILAKLKWGGKVSQSQFKSIMETLCKGW